MTKKTVIFWRFLHFCGFYSFAGVWHSVTMLLSYLKRGFPKGEKLFIIAVSVRHKKNLEKFLKGPLFFL